MFPPPQGPDRGLPAAARSLGPPRWAIVLIAGLSGLVLLTLLACGGLLVWLGTGPESGVKLAHEMDPYAERYLADHHVLEVGEQLVAYYDRTLAMDGTEAYVVTDRRVIDHRHGKNESVELAHVVDIRHEKDPLSGDVFLLQEDSGGLLKLEIDPLNGGATMQTALDSAWRRARGVP